MDRGARLFSFLEQASQLLHSTTSRPDPRELLCDLVEENLEFFRSFPEYVQHVASLQIANEFADLSNEVINDVVAFAAEAQDDCKYVQADLRCLAEIEGSWGSWHKDKFRLCWKETISVQNISELGEVRSDNLAPEDVGNRPIANAEIKIYTNFNFVQTVAPNLYNSVQFVNAPYAPGNVLELITGNFTKMAWRCTEKWPNDRLQRGAIDFIKRYLQSKHLMELHITAVGFELGELDDLLVKFVKKPFKRLILAKSSRSNGLNLKVGGYPLPFEAVEEACKTWESTNEFLIDNQEVRATVSDETFEKVKKRFPLDLEKFGEQKMEKEHPHVSLATLGLTLRDARGSKTVSLHFRRNCSQDDQ